MNQNLQNDNTINEQINQSNNYHAIQKISDIINRIHTSLEPKIIGKQILRDITQDQQILLNQLLERQQFYLHSIYAGSLAIQTSLQKIDLIDKHYHQQIMQILTKLLIGFINIIQNQNQYQFKSIIEKYFILLKQLIIKIQNLKQCQNSPFITIQKQLIKKRIVTSQYQYQQNIKQQKKQQKLEQLQSKLQQKQLLIQQISKQANNQIMKYKSLIKTLFKENQILKKKNSQNIQKVVSMMSQDIYQLQRTKKQDRILLKNIIDKINKIQLKEFLSEKYQEQDARNKFKSVHYISPWGNYPNHQPQSLEKITTNFRKKSRQQKIIDTWNKDSGRVNDQIRRNKVDTSPCQINSQQRTKTKKITKRQYHWENQLQTKKIPTKEKELKGIAQRKHNIIISQYC